MPKKNKDKEKTAKTPKRKPITYLLYELKPINQDHCGVICLDCGWVGVSHNRHDYKICPCPNEAMVDGGYDYMRCGAAKLDRIQTFKLVPHKNLTA